MIKLILIIITILSKYQDKLKQCTLLVQNFDNEVSNEVFQNLITFRPYGVIFFDKIELEQVPTAPAPLTVSLLCLAFEMGNQQEFPYISCIRMPHPKEFNV